MFRLELRDKDFAIEEILDGEYFDLKWTYSRIGGCGSFSFSLPRKIFEEKAITGDSNVRIYYRDQSTKSYTLWYQGLVENKIPDVSGNSESMDISGHGYVAQLSRIYLNNVSYSSQEISTIITDILDSYVTPNTNISYEAVDIGTTAFTPDAIDFNDTALSAIEKCADLAGGIEWGVDKDRNFFFKQKSTTVGFRHRFGKNIINFSEDLSFQDIVNRVIVQGAESGGTYYTNTYNDSLSQLKYNLRTKVIQNSSISTDSVAQQFATSYFAEYSEVVRKATCDLTDYEALVEATVPVPLMIIFGKENTYGTKKFKTGLYSGLVQRQVERVNYSISNKGSLNISIDLGQLRPSIAEEIAQLKYNLEQQRSAAL